MHISRRSLARTIAGLTGLAVTGCTINSAGGVTTVTLNLAKVDAYGQAIKNGAATLLTIPALVTALGAPMVSQINTTLAALAAAVTTLDNDNAGAVTLTLTLTSVPAALTALQSDAKTVFSSFSTVVTGLGSSIAADVLTTYDALQTIVSLLTALTATGTMAAEPKMTETQALSVLGVAH